MLRFILATGCLLAPVLAHAQAPTDSESVVRNAPFVVTAAPLSADAAGTTHLALDDTTPPATQSLAGLSGRLANFQLADSGAGSYGSLVTLRGLANTPYFSDPAVTVYFDDLPLASSFTYPTGLFGFSTVALYRGPQAVAFGRAGEAGVIVFDSAVPTAAAGGELRASYGNFAARSAALTARSARGDKLDATVSVSAQARDGYIENTQLHTRVDDVQSSAASARIRYRPAAGSELTLQLLGTRQRNGAQPLVPLGGPLDTVARAGEGSTDIDFGGVALKAAFETALGRLSATTSYTDWRMSPYENFLVLPPPLHSRSTLSQRAWNEEIRLASSVHAAREWNLGAWFSDTRTTGAIAREIPHLFPIEGSSYELGAQTAALFGSVDLYAASGWRVTAGLRAESVRKTFDRAQTVPFAAQYSSDRTFAALLPRLTVSYALAADTTASASVSAGTKPGGWSAYTDSAALARFSAERTLAFEAGVDTALAARTVRLAARVFAYQIDNYQIERSFNATDYLVVDAPRARSLGGELEASWHPSAAWTLAATLGVADLTLREFTDPFTHVSYSGQRAPYAPAFNASLGADYRLGRGWFASAELRATGRTYYVESGDPAAAQPAYAVASARLGYEASRWRLTLFGENLADAHYYALMIPGVGHGVPGAPRTFGAEISLQW